MWQQPQNSEAIDQMVRKDFVITSGGRDIVGRDAFKAWVIAFKARIHDLQFESIETGVPTRLIGAELLRGRNSGGG